MSRMAALALVLVCLPAVVVQAPAAEEAPGRLVGRVLRGTHASQLGIRERDEDAPHNVVPQGLAIGRNGDIYIGDRANGKIKLFSARGRFSRVMCDQADDWASFCVDGCGNLYVNETLTSSRLLKLDSQGRLVWTRTFSEILPPQVLKDVEASSSMELLSFFGRLTPGPADSVLVALDGWRRADRRPHSIGILLDRDGKLVRTLPSFGLWSNGFWWTYSSSMQPDQPPPTVTVELLSEEGHPVRTISLDTQADEGRHYRGVSTSVVRVLPDGDGGCYAIAYATKSPALEVTKRLSIKTEYVINHYDAQGHFLRELRIPTVPSSGSVTSLATGPDGSIYYLRLTPAGFEIRVVDRKLPRLEFGELGAPIGRLAFVQRASLPSVPSSVRVYKVHPLASRKAELLRLAKALLVSPSSETETLLGRIERAPEPKLRKGEPLSGEIGEWTIQVFPGGQISLFNGPRVERLRTSAVTRQAGVEAPSEEMARQASDAFLARSGLLPSTARFADIIDGRRIDDVLLSRIVRYDGELEGIPTEGPLGIEVGPKGQVLCVSDGFRRIAPDQSVPILSPSEGLSKLNSGEGHLAVGPEWGATAYVDSVRLAYWQAVLAEDLSYIMPIYVFEGEAVAEGKTAVHWKAYVEAVRPEFLEEKHLDRPLPRE